MTSVFYNANRNITPIINNTIPGTAKRTMFSTIPDSGRVPATVGCTEETVGVAYIPVEAVEDVAVPPIVTVAPVFLLHSIRLVAFTSFFIILEELLTSVRQSKDILLVPFRSDLKVTVATTPVPVLYVPGSTISPVMETFPDVILLVTAGKKVPLVTVCASRYAGSYTTQISVEVI